MIDVTLRFATLELAITALAAVRATGTDTKVEASTGPKADAPAKPAKETKPPAKTAETAPTADTAQTAASETKATASVAVNRDEMAAAIKNAAKTHRDVVVDTLAKFGAKVGKDVKDDQVAPFLAALAEAMKGGDDLS